MADEQNSGACVANQTEIGDEFNKWTIIGTALPCIRSNGMARKRWFCRCVCGTERVVNDESLRRGSSRSCGLCTKWSSVVIEPGVRIGKWTIRARDEKDARGRARWMCVCDCGGVYSIDQFSLRSGHSPRCFLCAVSTHGASRSSEYGIWRGIQKRCYLPAQAAYPMYGGRGITVCERWRESFENFIADMGPRPSDKHSIDRFPDKNGNYEPGNCRWATAKEQQRNMRSNRMLTLNGVTRCIAEWVEVTGFTHAQILKRKNGGWSDERTLTEPIQQKKSHKKTEENTMKAFLIFVAMTAAFLTAGCTKPKSATSAVPVDADKLELHFDNGDAAVLNDLRDKIDRIAAREPRETPTVDYSAEIAALQEQGARIEKSLSEKQAEDPDFIAMRADLKTFMDEMAAEKQAKENAAKEREQAKEEELVRPPSMKAPATKGGAPVVRDIPVTPIVPAAAAPVNLTEDGRLIVYAQTQPNCDPCVLWKAEGGGVRIGGERIYWEEMSKCPKDFQITGFPFFAWRDQGGQWWTHDAWTGVSDFEATVQRSLTGQANLPRKASAFQDDGDCDISGKTIRVTVKIGQPAPVARTYTAAPIVYAPVVRTVVPAVTYAAPVMRATRVRYPIRGNWWTGCSSWRHLTVGVHAGYFDTTWLQSLSWEELQSLHSAHHEELNGTGSVRWDSVVRPGQNMMRTTAVAAAGGTVRATAAPVYSTTYLPTYSSSIVYGSAVYAAPLYGVYGAAGSTYGKVQTRTTGAFGLTSRTKTVTGSTGVGVNAYGAPVAVQKSKTRTTTGLFGVPVASRTRTVTRGSACPNGQCPATVGFW